MALLSLCAALNGCATGRATPSVRKGLIDRLSTLKSGRHPGRMPSRDGRGAEGGSAWKNGPSRLSVAAVRRTAGEWRWPLERVVVTSSFGKRSGRVHEGVDLKAAAGTPVLAVQQGEVIYAGSGIGGYGRLVVLEHPSGLYSVYAHNSKLLVKRGERVRKGQRVSLSGQSGHATGPHLHFEIRKGERALDPELILPVAEQRVASR